MEGKKGLYSFFILFFTLINYSNLSYSTSSIPSTDFINDPFLELEDFYLQYFYTRSYLTLNNENFSAYPIHMNTTYALGNGSNIIDIVGFRLNFSKISDTWWNCSILFTFFNRSYTGSIYYNHLQNSWHKIQTTDNPLYVPFFIPENYYKEKKINFCTKDRENNVEIVSKGDFSEVMYTNTAPEFIDSYTINEVRLSFTDSYNNPNYYIYEANSLFLIDGIFYWGGLDQFCEIAFSELDHVEWQPIFYFYSTDIILNLNINNPQQSKISFFSVESILILSFLSITAIITSDFIKLKRESQMHKKY